MVPLAIAETVTVVEKAEDVDAVKLAANGVPVALNFTVGPAVAVRDVPFNVRGVFTTHVVPESDTIYAVFAVIVLPDASVPDITIPGSNPVSAATVTFVEDPEVVPMNLIVGPILLLSI